MSGEYPLPDLFVSGGVGGESARTEDLERASKALENAAQEVEWAEYDMRRAEGIAQEAIPDAIAEVRPAVMDAETAVYDARVGVDGCDDVAHELEDIAARIAAVGHAYEDAEATAFQGVSAATQAGRGVGDLLGLWTWTARTAWGNAIRFTPVNGVSHWIGDGGGLADAIRPDEFPRITGLANGASATAATGLLDVNGGVFVSYYGGALWLLSSGSTVLESWAGEPRYDGVTLVPLSEVPPQARGVADLLMNINDAYLLDHGGITIDTIAHADGTRSHVVNIPGTTDMTLSGPSVRDMNSNLSLVDDKPSDAAQMVRDAIEASGIEPGESIMLQGHSQGGMVASQLAASDLVHEYSITHVLTYGSTVGRLPINRDVQYMHLATTQDVTPGLDARPAVDAPNVTYAELDLLDAADPAIEQLGTTSTGAHSIPAYAAVGEAVDISSRTSVKAWRDSASEFMGDGQVTRQQIAPVYQAPVSLPIDPDAREPFMCFPPELGEGLGVPRDPFDPVIPTPVLGGQLLP